MEADEVDGMLVFPAKINVVIKSLQSSKAIIPSDRAVELELEFSIKKI